MASPDTDTDTDTEAQVDTEEAPQADQEFQPAGNAAVIRWQDAQPPADQVDQAAQPAEEPEYQPAGKAAVVRWQQPQAQAQPQPSQQSDQLAEFFPSEFPASPGAPAEAAPAGGSQEPAITNQARYYTPYDGTRPIDAIILHSSDGRTVAGDVNTLATGDPDHKVSAHYYTTADGQSLHFVNDNDIAYHAGATSGKLANYNNENTIGIEQQHVDGEPWKDSQVQGTAQTVADLLRRYPNLDINHVLGHSDIAPERKQDPLNFPWDTFRKYVAQDLAQGAGGTPAQPSAAAQPSSQLADFFPSEYGPPPEATAAGPPKAQPVPGGPVPRARPAAQGANGLYDYENPQDFVTGPATIFGDKNDIASGQDSGVGAPRLGGLPTTDIYGVAVPEWVLRSRLGNSPAAWRKARMDVVDPSSGNRLRVPIVDLGPSSAQEEKGIVADLTPGVDKFFNNQGGGKNLMFNLVRNAGPDVNSNTPEWNNEQAAIASGIDVGQTSKAAQTYPPRGRAGGGAAAPAEQQAWGVRLVDDAEIEGARQATQQQKQQQNLDALPILNNLQQQNPNPAAMIKVLSQPIEGVSDDTRNDYLANYKQQATKQAQEFYNEPDPDKALAKATGSVGVFGLGADFWHKIIAGAQEYQLPAAQAGPYGTAKNDINSFFGKAGITGDADQHAFLAKMATMSHDEREKAIAAVLPPSIPGVTMDLGPSTNPEYLSRAFDKIFDPSFEQQQNQEIARIKENVSKNLQTDPRLKGTLAGDASSMIGQSVADMATLATPALWPMFAAKISNQIRDQVKEQHPDWSEDEVAKQSTYGTLVATLGQVAAGHIFGTVAEPLLDWIKQPVLRALGHIGVGAAGGVGLTAGGQAAVNIATGQPVGQGVAQAAVTGGLMGVAGGIMHGPGVGELRRPAETRPEVTPPAPTEPTTPTKGQWLQYPPPPTTPVEPPLRPVTGPEITGPETTPETMPWYKPGPIVTRAEERTAFTPSELQQAIAEAPERGTTEQVAQSLRNLYPEPDWSRQRAYLQEQPYEPVETLPPLREPTEPTPPPPSGEAQPSREQPASVAQAPTPPHAEKPPNALPTEPAPLEQGTDKYVSSIANRFVQQKVEAGDIGEIAPGQGYATKDLVATGLKMSPEQVTQHMSDLMQGVGDPKAQAAAIRAEEARLSQRSAQASKIAEANPSDAQARIQADNAFNDLTDFHNGPLAKLKNNWHASGIAMQGEHEVDLSTFNGQRENWLRANDGKPPPAAMEPAFRESAARARKVIDAEKVAAKAFSDEVGKPLSIKIPSADEARSNIMERMGIGPCIV